jgi:hypothetical protein
MSRIPKLIVVAFVFFSAVIVASETASAQATARTARILQFQQHRGNFAQQNIARITGMVLQLNADGTFLFSVPNSSISPMSGRYTVQGNSITMSAGRTLRSAVGFTRGDMVAQIDMTNNGPVMTMIYATGSGMAAVINNTNFTARSSNAFYAVVLLR